MEHTLLVAHDDLRGLDFEESFQAVVADDDTAVELVDVGGGEAAAIEWDERTQVGRDYGYDVEDHPLGTVILAAFHHAATRLAERLNDVEAFEAVLLALVGALLACAVAKLVAELVEVELAEELVESLSTHAGDELVGVAVVELVVVGGEVLHDGIMFFLGEEVEFLHGDIVKDSLARLDDDIFFVIDDLVELLARDVEQGANLVGQSAEEPDVSHRDCELDMAHAFAAHFLLGDLDAAAVADDAFVTYAFVFAAVALPVAGGSEDTLAEQTVAFGLIGTIVDSLGLGDLAVGAFLDRLGRCQAYGYRFEIVLL